MDPWLPYEDDEMPDMEQRVARVESHDAICTERWETQRAENSDTCARLAKLTDLVTDLRLDLKSLAVKASIYFAVLAGLATIVGPVLAERLWK